MVDYEMLEECFDALKENLFMRRARKIALGSYGMTIVRKYFFSIFCFAVWEAGPLLSKDFTVLHRDPAAL